MSGQSERLTERDEGEGVKVVALRPRSQSDRVRGEGHALLGPTRPGPGLGAELSSPDLGIEVDVCHAPFAHLREGRRFVGPTLPVQGLAQIRSDARQVSRVAQPVVDVVRRAQRRLGRSGIAGEHLH